MDDKVNVYMRLYVGDWIAGTRGMTLEQRGAFVDLLCHMWNEGGVIPLDHEMLWRLVGADSQKHWERIWNAIKRKFKVDEAAQTFTNTRLQEERAKAQAMRFQAAENGKRGGRPKKPDPKPENNRPVSGMEPRDSFNSANPEKSSSGSGSGSGSDPLPGRAQAAPGEPLALALVSKPEPKKPTREPTRTDVAMGVFRNAWQAANGGRKWVSEPGVVPHLVRALDALTEAGDPILEFTAIVERYLGDTDPFIAQQGYSLSFLVNGGRFTRYRSNRNSLLAGMNKREIEGVKAAQIWLERSETQDDA